MAKGIFSSNETFEITVKYMTVMLKSGIQSVKVFDPTIPEDVAMMEKYKDRVQELTTIWIHPNFKINNEIARKCMVFDPYQGRREIDTPTYRAIVLETCLKNWDAVDDSDKKIPCTKEFIEKLDPGIALAITNEYMLQTTMTEEEAKN